MRIYFNANILVDVVGVDVYCGCNLFPFIWLCSVSYCWLSSWPNCERRSVYILFVLDVACGRKKKRQATTKFANRIGLVPIDTTKYKCSFGLLSFFSASDFYFFDQPSSCSVSMFSHCCLNKLVFFSYVLASSRYTQKHAKRIDRTVDIPATDARY